MISLARAGPTRRTKRVVDATPSGPARAKEIILECRRYGAEEARAMGLVHRIVPGSDLMKHAREYAQMLLAKPFRPLSEMKARINAIAKTGIPEVNAMTEGFLERD